MTIPHFSKLHLALVGVAIFLITSATAFFYFQSKPPLLTPTTQSPTVLAAVDQTNTDEELDVSLQTSDSKSTSVPLPTEAFNIALLGHGDAGHQGGGLTDAILIAHFNLKTKKFALITIPRDLFVTLPDGTSKKINAAFAGDATNASVLKSVLHTVTGLTVQYFVAVDFYGFTAIIDELKGVDVDLPTPVFDDRYPIRGLEQDTCGFSPEKMADLHAKYSGFELEKQFTCRYETLDYKAGKHHLDGATALKISRSRHGSSDFDRATRQQAILLGVKDGLLSLQAIKKAPQIFAQFKHTFSSDIDPNLIIQIASALTDFPTFTYTSINLDTSNVLTTSTSSAGAFILTPKSGDFSSLHTFISSKL